MEKALTNRKVSFCEKTSIEAWGVWGVAITFCLALYAHMLILPPFEGFDEPAHYSYISYLADQHRIPILGVTPLDRTMEEESADLPKPYESVPPYEDNGGITYKTFFEEYSQDKRQEIIRRFWSPPAERVKFVPALVKEWDAQRSPSIYSLNWEAQHPPLYYALMTVPYLLSAEWSAGARLLLLRFLTVSLAGFSVLFLLKSLNFMPANSRRFVLLGGVSILFFPSLFYDFARLGNDGLTAVIFSGAFYFLLACAYQQRTKRFRNLCSLSIFLGLGLLTKLFFLPITVGAIVYYIWLGRFSEEPLSWRVLSRHIALSLGIILLISGWWFALCFQRYGTIFVSEEFMTFSAVKDPLGLHLPFLQFVNQLRRSAEGFTYTFSWSGTQSWIPRKPVTYLLIFPLFGMIFLGFLQFIRERKKEYRWLIASLCIVTPIMMGFAYHMYTRVKFTGVGSGTGGYYMFVIWPAVGCIVALCFEKAKSWPGKYFLIMAFACMLFLDVSGWWLLSQVYAGIVAKLGHVNRGVGNIDFTISNIVFVLHRLKTIVFPYSANILYLITVVLKSVILICMTFSIYETDCNS